MWTGDYDRILEDVAGYLICARQEVPCLRTPSLLVSLDFYPFLIRFSPYVTEVQEEASLLMCTL